MIPIRDNIPSRTTPFVNHTIIAICALVFLVQLQESPEDPSLVEKFGMIPARVVNPDADIEITVSAQVVQTPSGPALEKITRQAAPSAVPPWLTLLTCVFLHGGWMHFLGNMWFLFIFGDNIEDRFGHFGYALFYLFCGVAASFVHFITETSSTVPTIGASGAIAGVMGAYFVWYPRAQVHAIVPIFVIIQVMVLPAPIFLGIWFLLQFIQGTTSITGGEAGGVAWWAHIGGFAAGVIIALIMGRTHYTRPINTQRRALPQQRAHLRLRH